MPGGEEWSTGFWMNDTGVTDGSLAEALANIISGTLSATDSSGAMQILGSNLWSAGVSWLTTRVYAYVTGGTKADFIGQYNLPSPIVGSGVPSLPNQASMVLTTLTGRAGRSYRGRMFLPVNKAALTADGNMQQSDVNVVVGGWATGFSDINTSDTGRIVLVSSKLDAATAITAVAADTRVDTQRSRAKSQQIDHRQTDAVTQHGS